MTAAREADRGIVLINVLVILALMGSVVFTMLSFADVSVARSQGFRDAAQATALIAAGEASAIVALRRDMEEAPNADHLKERWSSIGQEEVAIEGGRFALTVVDAQSRFDLNRLPDAGALGAQTLQRIVASLELPPDVGLRVAARLARPEPLERMTDLIADAGLTAAQAERLSVLADALAGGADINVNTAPAALIGILIDDPVQARRLMAIRDRNGVLTPDDLDLVGAILPPGTAYVSAFFDVTVTVTVGAVRLTQRSRLQRRVGTDGNVEVVVIGRDAGFGAAPPPVQ